MSVICGGVLTAAAFGAVLTSRADDWAPFSLVGLLFVLASGSELLNVEIRDLRLSGSFVAFVLAMALLGPAPAAALMTACILLDCAVSSNSFDRKLGNVTTFATVGLAGGLAMQALIGDFDTRSGDPLWFAAAVFGVFMGANTLNFLMVAGHAHFGFEVPVRALARSFVTALPSQFATALLTSGVAFTYGHLGMGSIGLAAVILFVFLYIVRTSVQAQERGEELTQRTRELASLQMGLLSTVLQTLSMRDAMTARHSAAVARYSREVAGILGCDEREQDLIHTAALLHDIGKFILPDSVLFANRKLTNDEWELIKLHPEQGAKLVERIEGYGPVAEIVLHHHEKYAGGGYPAGIGGEEIPLGARILSVADTYDVMTARDSYRRPVSSEAALAELRRVAGTQLDPKVVEAFERMILEKRVAFSHTDEADFEHELAFERRVIDYARPRLSTAA
ncbi:HD domain-containing protein [Solirubrobacter ginsenosidimutans]|uniref:HD domain-containing protein n=1 Tax=Solirubrobacter ginsenosidimutans TaxID=490573 RepID=A0A9X3SBT3_9ACTN|nr:HD domain-containing phosphohydrolase [Solirubrobacter ginsenosidimutans]MDA0167293.1 HD domain-containing protein [Solirubrobacter ginsenosidimutans]